MAPANKKELRKQIENLLFSTFGELKTNISEKKFNTNVKKASRNLVAGLKHTPKKNAEAKAVVSKEEIVL